MDDIRNFQIFFQLVLISLGLWSGYLLKGIGESSLIIFSALLGQLLFINKEIFKLNWKSPLITSLSIILILKSSAPYILPCISFLSILSKALLKDRDGHVFNPSLVGIIFSLYFLKDFVWITPGAWGESLILISVFIMCGLYILFNVSTSRVLYSFLGSYAILLFLRMNYLGDPIEIYLHQVSNISFILFVFFMVSDPKTSPQNKKNQILFGSLIAIFAYYFKFYKFNPSSLYLSLLLSTCIYYIFNQFKLISIRKKFYA